MSILTDNAITRLISSSIDKLKLGALLIDDLFKYFFTANSLEGLRKYLYLTGLAYMAFRTTYSLTQWWHHWGWTFKQSKFTSQFNPDEFKMRYGFNCWVVVTGFASGIGLSFAQQFARLGYNLVLIDCQKERSVLSERWVRQYNKEIQTRVIIVDLTEEEEVIRGVVGREIEGLDIGILVNNAGMSAGGEYIDIQTKKLIDCYKLNILTAIHLTKLLLPQMLSRSHRSAILNIGSGIGQLSSPVTGIYPATKQYIRIFSRSLDLQQSTKIDVLCVKPLGVITNMMNFTKHDWTMVTPEAVSTQAIRELGKSKETFGAVQHKILATVLGGMSEEGRFREFIGRYKK